MILKIEERLIKVSADVANLMTYLAPNSNLTGVQYHVADVVNDLAQEVIDTIEDSSELSAGLRKLLEAKDCFVRASLDL
jgi:hypothetical protein